MLKYFKKHKKPLITVIGLFSTFLQLLPSVSAVSEVFTMVNNTGNVLLVTILFLAGLVLSFLNLGRVINLFGSFLLVIVGLIIMFNFQTILGMLVLVLGFISMTGVSSD